MAWHAGCSWQSGVYLGLEVDPGQSIVYCRNYKDVVIAAADGSDPVPFFWSETAMIAPRFSPEGEKIAALDVGNSNLPASSIDVVLVAAWRERGEVVIRDFPLPQFDVDHKLIVDDAVPPMWEPGGESILVALNTGIERITLTGDREYLVEEDRVYVMTLMPDGDRVAYSNGENIFFVSRMTGERETMLDPDLVPRFGNRQIYAMAFSETGDRLVFSVGHELYVLTVATKSVELISKASNGIYWVGWVPGKETIVYLSGREDRRSFYQPMTYNPDGKYKLTALTASGERPREIFSQNQFDVRDVTPDLSPDGRYIAFTGRVGYVKEIYIAATDGSGVTIVTQGGPNRYPHWRPVR
jgi:hypothetical protein